MSQATTGIETALRRETSLGTAQVIRSPEQVALDLQVAGPMSRMLAFSIDYGVILILEAIVFTALLLGAISMASLDELEQVQVWIDEAQASLEQGELDVGPWFMLMLAAWIALDFLLQWGYFVACELLMQGRSPGKAMIGLRVVRDGGLPVTLRESMLRNLLRMVDMLPTQYFVGFVCMIFSKEVRRLGDFAAGTIVIREERAGPARPIAVTAEPAAGSPAFRFDRDQLDAMGPVELRLVRQTLRRIDELPSWKVKEVLGRTVGALCTRIGWQEPLEPGDRREFLMALLRDADRG
jgi:uncharacterized RDD family membrane protein YckC